MAVSFASYLAFNAARVSALRSIILASILAVVASAPVLMVGTMPMPRKKPSARAPLQPGSPFAVWMTTCHLRLALCVPYRLLYFSYAFTNAASAALNLALAFFFGLGLGSSSSLSESSEVHSSDSELFSDSESDPWCPPCSNPTVHSVGTFTALVSRTNLPLRIT